MYSKNMLKYARLSIAVTLIAAALSSISLSLTLFTSGVEDGKLGILGYIIASVFWFGWVVVFFATRSTKKTLHKYREKLIAKGELKRQHPVGAISFSKQWKMLVLYGVIVLGLVLIITDMIFRYIPEAVVFPITSITVLSFAVHCVVDGKYYEVYKQIKESVKNETNH